MKSPALAGFRESLKHGRRARIVVPTATLAEHLRHELVRNKLVIRARDVSTLAQFVKELAPDVQVVSSELFHLMVEDALRRVESPEFQKVLALPGFHTRLAKTISDLDAAGCTPAHVLEQASVGAVWQDVDRQMRERKMVMRGESLRLAATLAHKQADIWFEGFAEISRPERELIAALGATVSDAPERGRAATTAVVVPETAEREVEEIARRVLEIGNYREIGVVLRKPEKYVPLLRAVFERFGVPAHFYFHESLGEHPAARMLCGVVDALLNGWEHEDVLKLLRFSPSAGASDVLDEFAIKVRENLPGRGLERVLELAGARLIPQRILKSFQQIDAWHGDRLTSDEWAARLSHVPSLFGPGALADHVSQNEAEQYRWHAAGLKALAHAMESAASWWVDKSATIDLARFWEVARSVFRLSEFPVAARSRNVVHVIHAWEARQWELDTVFVCGMVEKDFPAQNARDPFFSDSALRAMGARTSQDKDDAERALFDEVCGRARELVVLSYPRVDARGQRNLKSIFLNGMDEEVALPVVRPSIPAAIAQWQPTSRIHSHDLLDILTERHAKMSVTAIESLLQCPFQFFADKTLRVAELPCRPEDRLDFLVQGNIAHDVLREWFDTRGPLEPLFTRLFQAACDAKNVQPGFRTERMRRVILLALKKFEADGKYPLPLKSTTEQSFELGLNDGLTIRGKLDRIDEVGDDGAVVIDYKFSAAKTTKDRIDDPTKLQGPLYAWAAEKQFGRTAAAMVYISLKGGERPKYFGWGCVPGADLKGMSAIPTEWIPQALARAAAAVNEFRSGIIHPHPANTAPCRYCDYRDACRAEQQPLAIPAR